MQGHMPALYYRASELLEAVLLYRSASSVVLQSFSHSRNRNMRIMKHSFLLFVVIVFTSVSESGADTEFVCEFRSKTISCSNEKTINIMFANYGRIGHNVCFHRSVGRINNCYEESHTSLVAKMCNGKSSCTLIATNDIFGDTCSGILKYLQVKYKCI